MRVGRSLFPTAREPRPVVRREACDRFEPGQAPPCPQSEAVPTPTEAYAGIPFDDPVWSRTGSTVRLPDGALRTDVGGGLRVYTYPDGGKSLEGTRMRGLPVRQFLNPDGDMQWTVAHDQAIGEMLSTARHDAVESQRSLRLEGQPVDLVRYAAGRGAHVAEVRFGGARGTFQLVSQSQLSFEELQNVAQVIAEDPEATFAATRTFYVADQVGQLRMGGQVFEQGGTSRAERNTIFFARSELSTLDQARDTMNHEISHILLRLRQPAGQPPLSRTAQDDQGGPLFGAGRYHVNPDGTLAADSDYVSEYAQTDPDEDACETHVALMEARREYNTAHPGEDLLHVPPATWFPTATSRLQQKLAQVETLYQEVGRPLGPEAERRA